MLKLNCHSTSLGNNYNKDNFQYNKQSVEEVLVQKVVETTIQTLYGEGLFDNYANID